jgi:hypothetical protein
MTTWKRPEFEVFADAKHPQTPQIRQLSFNGRAVIIYLELFGKRNTLDRFY